MKYRNSFHGFSSLTHGFGQGLFVLGRDGDAGELHDCAEELVDSSLDLLFLPFPMVGLEGKGREKK